MIAVLYLDSYSQLANLSVWLQRKFRIILGFL